MNIRDAFTSAELDVLAAALEASRENIVDKYGEDEEDWATMDEFEALLDRFCEFLLENV